MDNREELREKIVNILSEQLGVDPEDIHDDDNLKDQLHMSATDIADFLDKLAKQGFDTSSLVLTEVETFEDVVEAISLRELIK